MPTGEPIDDGKAENEAMGSADAKTLHTNRDDNVRQDAFNVFLTEAEHSTSNFVSRSTLIDLGENGIKDDVSDVYDHLSYRTEGEDLLTDSKTRLVDTAEEFEVNGEKNTEDGFVEVQDQLENVRESELTYREYCLRNKGETTSEITSIAITSHKCHMIVCDHVNGTINLVDKQFQLVFKYHSCFKAFGVAVLDSSFFVVTFPFVRLMQYFKFKSSFTKFAPWFPVKAQNEYYGVCGVGDRIVAVCKYDGDNRKDIPGVHILNRQGHVLSIVTKDADDKQLFIDPDYIAINNSSRAIYVSDSGAGAIVCLNLAGEVLSLFASTNFTPTGLAIDSSMGIVYVNDIHSKSVVSFSQDLSPVQKIKAQMEKLTGLLSSTYCIKSDRLIVSMNESPYLKTFTL